MRLRTRLHMAVATLALVTVALSTDWLLRTQSRRDTVRAAQAAIRSQLDAFSRDDYPAAYAFASREIQEQFPLTQFRQMVERGYPQIARSRAALFGDPMFHEEYVSVPVSVTGQDGVTAHVIYSMRREQDRWRVAAVLLNHPPDGPAAGKEEPPPESGPGAERRSDAGSKGAG
jgi:hypothetical protein